MARPTPAGAVSAAPPGARAARAYNLIFWILLLAFEVFLLSLPLLPNGDGPVHIYLSSVLWKLATHSSPLYERYYAIRHLVQPYSFHYYFLIWLEHFVSPDAAEKLFAAGIWATLALGFRALARALGPGAPAVSLLIFPLLFSWPLSAGFFNFTFGCGLLLWALAFYMRLSSAVNPRVELYKFALTLVLLVLAHPIPILVLICLLILDLGFQGLASWRTERMLRLPVWQAAALGLACSSFLFPILIADKASVASSVRALHPGLHLLRLMLSGYYVTYFQVHSILGWTYHGLILALLPACAFLCLRSGSWARFRAGRPTGADRLLSAALLFLAASLIFPQSMNGSALFAARMWYMVWLVAAACAAAAPQPPWLRRSIAAFGVAVGSVSLAFGIVYLRPVARQQAALERAPLPTHTRGLFFQPPSSVQGVWTHTWWGLNYWGGVRAFTAHEDVLLNTPWLQLTIVPVEERGRSGLMRDVLPNFYSEAPSAIFGAGNPRQLPAALAMADFILFADPNGAPPEPLRLASRILGPAPANWACTQHDFYAICERR